MPEQRQPETAANGNSVGTPHVEAHVRRLPAVVRYLIAAILGCALAGLTSYLLRSIGF